MASMELALSPWVVLVVAVVAAIVWAFKPRDMGIPELLKRILSSFNELLFLVICLLIVILIIFRSPDNGTMNEIAGIVLPKGSDSYMCLTILVVLVSMAAIVFKAWRERK